MIILTGLIYSLYFMLLGFAARASYHLLNKSELIIEKKTDFLAHALFLGIFLHIAALKFYQLLGISNQSVLYMTFLGIFFSGILIVVHAMKHGFHTVVMKPSKTNILSILLIVLLSIVIYLNGSMLPSIAWDSWMVWIGKANQWLSHGLDTPIYRLDPWLQNPESIYNASAHYPEALPLLYFLPKLFNWDSAGTLLVFYLVSFAMMSLLLVSRIERKGAPWYLQLLLVFVLYTTPLLNNHLMIAGYADIWMAMLIVIILLTLIDYHEKGDFGVGITLLCYLAMLPLFKLEGWVWLLLFLIAHVVVTIINTKHKNKFFISLVLIILLMVLIGGIEIHLPMGNIILNSERIEFLHLIKTDFEFSNINSEVLIGFFGQNNWSILWLGLPFLLVSFFINKHNKASQVAQVFFMLAMACFFFLFYFTKASQWAKDLTALNRVVLQLVPCYIFLLFEMLIRLKGVETKKSTNPED